MKIILDNSTRCGYDDIDMKQEIENINALSGETLPVSCQPGGAFLF